MNTPMGLRTLHTPEWMEEDLKKLAFLLKIDKAELTRRMIAVGLDSCWNHLFSEITEPHPIIDTPPQQSSDVVDLVMHRHTQTKRPRSSKRREC